jgi:hypothetical protein
MDGTGNFKIEEDLSKNFENNLNEILKFIKDNKDILSSELINATEYNLIINKTVNEKVNVSLVGGKLKKLSKSKYVHNKKLSKSSKLSKQSKININIIDKKTKYSKVHSKMHSGQSDRRSKKHNLKYYL